MPRIISGRYIESGDHVRVKYVDDKGHVAVVFASSILSHEIERAFRVMPEPPKSGRVAQR